MSSLLPVRSGLLTPHAILVSITRRLPKRQVAAVRPRCTGRDFDAISVLLGQFCPWTSQAARGSSQSFFHPFSRYYMSRASLSRCVTCKTVIHTDFWNWLCALRGPDLFAPKSVRQGRIPFCSYGVRASPRQFQRGHRALLGATCRVSPGVKFFRPIPSVAFIRGLFPKPRFKKPILFNKLTAIVPR